VQIGRIDLNKLRGFGEKVVGLNKEFIGAIVGNEKLEKEGEAQQAKATQKLKALREEVKAQGHEAKAEALEEKEKAAQRAKQSA
jgi:uncharacterized protein YjbJ (UPF0337 family)